VVAIAESTLHKKGNLYFKDDSKADKERKLQQLSQNAYDMVLMSEPVFQSIELDADKEIEYLDDIVGRHVKKGVASTDRAREKALQRQEAKQASLANRRLDKSNNITWEELGIDALFADEAHHLKNLFAPMRQQGTAFISSSESKRSLDFYYKSRQIRENNDGGNVFMLTATPTVNNPLEVFNMMQFVAPEEFDRRGISNVDDFLEMFGRFDTVSMPGTNGELQEKTGLTGFKHLKDLRKLFFGSCQLQNAKDVGLPIPEEITHNVEVEMTPEQQRIYATLRDRATALQHSNDKESESDHIFSVISDMDKAATSLSWYDATASGNAEKVGDLSGVSSPKIEECARLVMSSKSANEGKQIIFCDANEVHDDIKAKLVSQGYPAEKIAIVNGTTCKRSSDRKKISDQYNSGQITLVIGNTATMGEGVNLQIGTTDIHHINTPWTPKDETQRNGRGVRQGNKLDEVQCHYYHAKGSFDGYRQATIARKRGWINELWKGSEDDADNQDTGKMSGDEMTIALSADPEKARRELESNRQLQEQRLKQKKRKDALSTFKRLQSATKALDAIKDKEPDKANLLGTTVDRMRRSLAANSEFTEKELLSSPHKAIATKDGLITSNSYIKYAGRYYQVQSVNSDNTATIMQVGLRVSPDTVKASKLARESISISDGEMVGKKISDSLTISDVYNRFTQGERNNNRDRILSAIRENNPGASVPVLTKDGELSVKPLRDLDNTEGIIWNPAPTPEMDKAIVLAYGDAGFDERQVLVSLYRGAHPEEHAATSNYVLGDELNKKYAAAIRERRDEKRSHARATTESAPTPASKPPSPAENWSAKKQLPFMRGVKDIVFGGGELTDEQTDTAIALTDAIYNAIAPEIHATTDLSRQTEQCRLKERAQTAIYQKQFFNIPNLFQRRQELLARVLDIARDRQEAIVGRPPITSSSPSSDRPTLNHNKERNGIELKFPGKPSDAVRQKLKANGFRWSRNQGVWYAKDNEARSRFAETLVEPPPELSKNALRSPRTRSPHRRRKRQPPRVHPQSRAGGIYLAPAKSPRVAALRPVVAQGSGNPFEVSPRSAHPVLEPRR
jgi:hypothetical protein